SLDDQKDKIEVITKGTLDTDRIYDLSYVQIPHKVADAQGQMVDASQTMPDVRNLSEAQKRETEVIFDRSLGYLTSISQYGMQPYYATMKKERLMDRFRINGLKIMDYLAANGFPEIKGHFAPPADADPARKAAILKESETAQKAALMTALADPNLSVTFVPYILDERERPVESAPIKITPKRDLILDETRDFMTQLPQLPEDEGAKYLPGLGKHTVSFGMILNMDPEIDLVGMQQDEQVKDTLKNDPLLQNRSMKFMTPGTINRRFYLNPAENTVPGFDELFKMKVILPTGAENAFGYSVLKGTNADGTLSEEGKKNLASVKSYMHAMRDKTNALADSYEKESPVLSEHLRLYSDEMRTVEDGPVWQDLARDYAYSNLRAQSGGLGAINSSDVDSSSPQFMKNEFEAYTNYPTGEPSYRLPQAAEAARRQVLVRAEHERARREGVLTARQDRLTRRILLSELDELERDLRSIDTLTEKSRIAGSPEQAYVSMLENKEAGHRGYLDNNVFESSRYFARGTRLVWMDMEGKRAMLANGWPLEDLNLLSHLYIRRAILQSTLSDKDTLEK
ncbi:MAG: hypothetical protein II800_07445, partial [Lachnospiraceae bacterium]|nr:hypothetical protein [Lachnospiraceae bacterium]